MDYEQAVDNLENLKKWYSENDMQLKRNEASTRFHLINQLFKDCLGWNLNQFDLEQCQNGEYTDYELGKPAKRLVIEAKREGNYFELPAGFDKIICRITTLMELRKDVKKAIEQAMGYCQKRGIQIGVVSNGHQIIAFIGTRHDGVPPINGLAIVFDSFDSMRRNFIQLWNALSPTGISENRILTLLSDNETIPAPNKLSTSIVGFPGYKNRNPVAAELQIFGGLFLEDIGKMPENEELFINKTYCSSGALSQYILVSKEIINSRYSSYFEKDTQVSVKPVRTRRGIQPELREDLLAAGISQRPIILVGDVGVGKSMFIKHLVFVDAKDILEEAIVLYMDFGSKPTLVKDLPPFVINEFERQLREKYSIDVYENQFVRGVYNLDIQRYRKGIFKDLIETDPTAFKKKEIEYLEKLTNDKENHLKSSIKHIVKGQNKTVVFFLDNVDQRDFEFQEQVFIIAQTFAQEWPVITFITLRPDTFTRSRISGSLSAYQPRVFTIDPPRVDKVIQKRLDYALEMLKTTGKLPSFPKGVSLSSNTLESYIEMLSKAFNDSVEIIEFVDNMSNGNLRKALDFIVKFVGSAHVDSEKIFKIIETNGNYTLPLHEFLRSIIFLDSEFYNPKESPIYNLYDISSNDKNEHFLTSILLSYVERMGAITGNEGFVQISDIYNYLQSLGYSERQIKLSIQNTIHKELLASPRIETSENISKIRIQSSGVYTIKKLATLFSYTDAIITDTPITSKDLCSKIQVAHSIEERLTRAGYFLEYLNGCWDNKLAGMYDWIQISQKILAEIAQIKNRISNKNNHITNNTLIN